MDGRKIYMLWFADNIAVLAESEGRGVAKEAEMYGRNSAQ